MLYNLTVSGSVRTHVTSVGESPVANVAYVWLNDAVRFEIQYWNAAEAEPIAGALRCQADLGKSSIIHLFLAQAHTANFISKEGNYLFTSVSSDVAFEEPLTSESLVAIRAHAIQRYLRASADVVLMLGQAGSDELAVHTGKRLSRARGSRRRRRWVRITRRYVPFWAWSVFVVDWPAFWCYWRTINLSKRL